MSGGVAVKLRRLGETETWSLDVWQVDDDTATGTFHTEYQSTREFTSSEILNIHRFWKYLLFF